MKINVYSHGFSVTDLTPTTRGYVSKMCRLLGQLDYRPIGGGRTERYIARVFAGGTADHSTFWFHRGELERFKMLCQQYMIGSLDITYHGLYEPRLVVLPMKDLRPPREYQLAPIAYVLEGAYRPQQQQRDGVTKIVTLGPGRGKTFVLNKGLHQIGQVTVFVIKPMYIAKWIGDLDKALELKPGDLLVAQGGKQLNQIMELAIAGELKAKVLLISNATYRLFIQAYEDNNGNMENTGFALSPIEFLPAVKAGVLAVDEVHQDFHFNYRLNIYSHVPLFVCLSGTLVPDDSFKREMCNVMFPPHERYTEEKPPPHIKAIALEYHFRKIEKIRWTNRGMTSYSQIALEKSIMKHEGTFKRYLDMIGQVVENSFIPLYRPGYKALIYCGTKIMCTRVRELLKERFPHLNVVRYNASDDPYSNVEEGEVIVSTLKSLGTAIDIPGLIMTLMTDSLNDTQANLQAIKRLRPVEDEYGKTILNPEFLYFVCRDIRKQIDYHIKKIDMFVGEVTGHQLLSTEFNI